MRFLAFALAMGLGMSGAHALEGVTVTPLVTKTETASGQPIVLPQRDIHVVVSRYEIAPGATLPVHKHPFARYAVVETGTLEVTNAATGASTVYGKGDFVVEMIDAWHSGRNIGPDVIRLIVIDQTEGSAANTILEQTHP
ncbi:cupin domain-containing protein [Methylobrevis pamukkalensis]|uniref:Cupin domain protein n=1 Tax=Methylobrevis pamukkalensis TaxID=1439726 RepID=A0A1E3GWQ2_9HYPH|nr:cupin domain-containing protein [Methylobrevis pamukkalensis]ODN68488.1 Cupin domain protein [Methylobrevis pamukkalensis]